MTIKRFCLAMTACLILTGLPLPGLALTLTEIMGTQASSSYTPVTVTSATNKTITITATPQSFSNNQWTYQLAWNRAKNAKGSLYVSLKSSPSTKVATVATADQAGSVTFTALPSTAYRVEFYSQPNGKGSLLVRKYFTALAADKVTVNSTPIATTNTLNGSTPYLQPNTQTFGTSNYGTFQRGMMLLNVGPLTSESLDTLLAKNQVAGPIPVPSANSAACSSALLGRLMAQASSNDAAVTPTFACQHINQQFVAQLGYQSSATQQCYWADMSGTYKLPSCLPNLPVLPTDSAGHLSLASIPSVSDPSFDWGAAAGGCWSFDDSGNFSTLVCGGRHFGPGYSSSGFPDATAYCQANQNAATCQKPSTISPSYAAQNNRGFMLLGLNEQMPGMVEKFSTTYGKGRVGAAIPVAFGGSCSSSNRAYLQSSFGSEVRNPDQSWMTIDFSCSHISTHFVTQLMYKSSQTKECYFADMNGTWNIPCDRVANLPTLDTDQSGQLALSNLPAVTNSGFDWGAAGAQCASVDQVGKIVPSDCGGVANAQKPTSDQYCFFYPNASTCQTAAPAVSGTNGQGTANRGFLQLGISGQMPTLVERLAKSSGSGYGQVSGPIPVPSGKMCTAKMWSDLQASFGSQTLNPDQSWMTIDFACNHVSSSFITQVMYQSSQTKKCYWADMNGTFSLPCGLVPNLPALNTDSSGQLSQFNLPIMGDTTFDWYAAGALCASVDQVGRIVPVSCVNTNTTGMTESNFCQFNPTVSTCQTPSVPTATQTPAQILNGNSNCPVGAWCGSNVRPAAGY